MANEITKLKSNNLNAELLFIYRSITAPTYTDADSATITVVASPSSTLPAEAVGLLSVAEKAALDAGTDAFEVVEMEISESLTNPQLLAAAQALYTVKQSAFQSHLTSTYHKFGFRLDAP